MREKRHYILLENWYGLFLFKVESPSPRDALNQIWLNWHCGFSPWGRVWQILLKLAYWFRRRRWKCEKIQTEGRKDRRLFIRKAWFSFQLRLANLRVKFIRNIGSGDGYFKISSMYLCYFVIIWKRAFHLNKIKFPSTNNVLCQVKLKLAEWFLRRRF